MRVFASPSGPLTSLKLPEPASIIVRAAPRSRALTGWMTRCAKPSTPHSRRP